jgi:hypothetical protein
VRNGAILTTETRTLALATTEAYVSVGGANYLWGEEWTPADINNADFGVALFVASAPGGVTFSIDHVKCTVFYTTVTGISKVENKFTSELAIPNLKGGRTLSLTLPWIDDTNLARDYGYQLLRTHRYPLGRLTMRFAMDNDDTREAMLGANPGKLIYWKSPSTIGVQGDQSDDYYRVESRKLDAAPGGDHWATITLIPSYQYRNLDAIAWDDFNRPDATGSLGVTPTGDDWEDDATWNIVSNKAVPQTGAMLSYFDLGKASMVVEITLAGMSSVMDGAGVSYRGNAGGTASWFAFFDWNASLIKLQLLDGVSSGVKASAAWTRGATGELRVIVQGNRHRVWANRKLVIDYTSTNLNTSTRAGLLYDHGSGSVAAQFGPFYAQGLIV